MASPIRKWEQRAVYRTGEQDGTPTTGQAAAYPDSTTQAVYLGENSPYEAAGLADRLAAGERDAQVSQLRTSMREDYEGAEAKKAFTNLS